MLDEDQVFFIRLLSDAILFVSNEKEDVWHPVLK